MDHSINKSLQDEEQAPSNQSNDQQQPKQDVKQHYQQIEYYNEHVEQWITLKHIHLQQ